MKILMIGPQGSGKSTQAKLLAQFLQVPKISTGDIFRKLSKENGEEARSVKDILGQGKLVDDETTAEIVKKRLQQSDTQNGFIFDGYPRNINQVKLFDPGFDKVIYLKTPKEELIRRLVSRSRADDTFEAINTRLDLYFTQTEPLLDYYRQKSSLVEVDGMGDINQIQDEIKKFI
mgnify:CR=1 FL=1